MDKIQSFQAAAPSLASGNGAGLPSSTKDAKESSQATQYGDLYKQIQSKYGEKAEKPREIKKNLDKDDFLRIMIAQMKNQDPTNPFKAEQMATELAQFSSVEQLHNVNQNLSKMAAQNKPLEQLAMTNLIGKEVTVNRDRFPHIQGKSEVLKFNLPKDASRVKVALLSDAGEVVIEKELGAQKKGEGGFDWDGKKTNTLLAASGSYMVRVEAADDRGHPIEINSQTRAKVIGVSFDKGEPVFLVGDAKHHDRVTIDNIMQVEMASDLPKGGSPPLANQGSQVAKATQPNQIMTDSFGEKGFPNGLNDSEAGNHSKIEKGGN